MSATNPVTTMQPIMFPASLQDRMRWPCCPRSHASVKKREAAATVGDSRAMQTARFDPEPTTAPAAPARPDPMPAYAQRLAHWEGELRRVRSREIGIAWGRGATVVLAV